MLIDLGRPQVRICTKAILLALNSLCFSLAASAQTRVCSEVFSYSKVPGVSLDLVREMKSRQIDEHEARLNDALRANGLSGIFSGQKLVADHDTLYTKQIPGIKIQDQKSSGRCWIFAGLSALEGKAGSEKIIAKSTSLSRTYLHFFNMLERSNSQLEEVLKLRLGSTRIKTSTALRSIHSNIGDGGWYEDFQFLVAKYGVVPVSAMPETYNSQNSALVLKQLNEYLQDRSYQMWNMSLEMGGHSQTLLQTELAARDRGARKPSVVDLPKLTPDQIGVLESFKSETLKGVWKILEANLGRPPDEFRFKEQKLDKGEETSSEVRTFTPKQFAFSYLNYNPDDFVSIVNLPNRLPNQLLQVSYPFMNRSLKMLNLGSQRMQQLVAKMIDVKQPVWFAIDVNHHFDTQTGIVHPRLKVRDGLYYFSDSQKPQQLSQQENRFLGRVSANHAMLFIAYDLPKGYQTPRKLGAQNSWSEKSGDEGIYHIYPQAFEETVQQILVLRSVLTPEEQKMWDGEPVKLSPAFDFE